MEREPATLQWLRPSAVEGAWILKLALQDVKNADVDSTVRLLSSTYSSAGFDFDAARSILATVGVRNLGRAEFFRAVFYHAIELSRPPFLVLAARGRMPFAEALPVDAAECLRRCGALEDFPTPDALGWFDELASLARSEGNIRRMVNAREAERRSFEYEQARLVNIAGCPPPRWVALDDNAAGFDIHSSEPTTDSRFMPKLIEVKACSDSLEFYLTRNEYNVAQRHSDAYVLHLWNLRTCELTEIPWTQVRPWLPADTARGTWTETRVRWARPPS